MEKLRHNKGSKLVEWRSGANAEKITADIERQLNMLAELAESEGVDFKQKATDYERGIGGDGKHHDANVLDLLLMWAYTKGVIKDTEYRELQKVIAL